MKSPHVFVEQSEVVAALMPAVCDSVETSEWWCISKTLAEALQQIDGQTVVIDWLGCWWAVPYQGPGKPPEQELQRLGLAAFLA